MDRFIDTDDMSTVEAAAAERRLRRRQQARERYHSDPVFRANAIQAASSAKRKAMATEAGRQRHRQYQKNYMARKRGEIPVDDADKVVDIASSVAGDGVLRSCQDDLARDDDDLMPSQPSAHTTISIMAASSLSSYRSLATHALDVDEIVDDLSFFKFGEATSDDKPRQAIVIEAPTSTGGGYSVAKISLADGSPVVVRATGLKKPFGPNRYDGAKYSTLALEASNIDDHPLLHLVEAMEQQVDVVFKDDRLKSNIFGGAHASKRFAPKLPEDARGKPLFQAYIRSATDEATISAIDTKDWAKQGGDKKLGVDVVIWFPGFYSDGKGSCGLRKPEIVQIALRPAAKNEAKAEMAPVDVMDGAMEVCAFL